MKSTKHMWKRCLSVLLVLCMIGAFILPHVSVQAADAAADLWVDPVAGDDANDGLTEATALKSIQAAKSKAAALSEDKDVVVILKAGTYDASETIVFGSEDSGRNGHTITYRAASGATPIISGGTRLEGWTLHDAENNIYVTDIPAGTELTRQFYVNGEPQRVAGTESSPTDWAVLATGGYYSPVVNDQNSNEYLILDMGKDTLISSVVLYAGLDRSMTNGAAGYPQDFTISTSNDGVNWTVQVDQKDQEAPVSRGAVEFNFATVGARYIKLDVTKLGEPTRKAPDEFFLALTEICVGLAGEKNKLDLGLVQHLDLDTDLAGEANIVDGALVIDVNDVAIPVGGVNLTVNETGKLANFKIQATSDGQNWVTVIEKTDYDWSKAKNNANTFSFDAVPATQIRIVAAAADLEVLADVAVYGPASLSTGANVTVSSGTNTADKLVDGKLDGVYESKMTETSSSIDATIVVDLGSAQDIGGVRLFPNYENGVAVDYLTAAKISVSDDGETYTHVMTLNNIAAPTGGAQLLLFSKAYKARFVKIEPMMVNGVSLQLRELQVAPAKPDAANNPAVTIDKADLTVLGFGYYNGGDYTEYSDNRDNIVDGNVNTSGTSKGQQYHWMPDNGGANTPAIIVGAKDGGAFTINTMELVVSRDGMNAPYSYYIDVTTSKTQDNWTTIYSATGLDWTDSNVDKIQLPEMEIYKLRLCVGLTTGEGTREEWVGGSWCYLEVNELSLYNINDTTNPYSSELTTQGENASAAVEAYKVHTIEAKNDNPENIYSANKAIDGTVAPYSEYGWLVPESYGLAETGNMEDIEIHVLNLWYHHTFKVTGGSGDGTELYAESGAGWMPTWVSNHYAFIDCVGEWYIDRDELKIYYKADGTMDDKVATLPVAEQCVIVSGASNIIFDGVSFQHTSWTLTSLIGYYDAQANHFSHESMEHDWTEVPAGIKVEFSHDITFTNCEITNMGTMGILLTSEGGPNTRNVTIENCYIHDLSYNGIVVGEVYGHHGYQSWWRVDNTVIRNNYIARIGLDRWDSTGILATYTNGTIIDHNEVCYVPYSGISTGWGWEDNSEAVIEECGNIQVTNNKIHNVMKTNRDGGNFYNLGEMTNGKLAGNYIYNSWDYSNTYENGLYLDMGSAFWEVYNNVVGENVGYWLHMWTASIRNNYWHDNFYVEGTKQREDGTDNVLENNIAVKDGDFSKYPKAMEIINNAGLLKDVERKYEHEAGFATQHDVIQSFYPGNGARYIHATWGWNNVAAEGQVNKTSYDSINRQIIITVAPNADLSKVVLSFECEDDWKCDKKSGETYDFTQPIQFTLTNDAGQKIVWTVTVKNKAVTTGEIPGEDVNLGDLIADSEETDWSKKPVRIIGGMAYFNGRSGYTAKTFGNDAIYTFDFKCNLSPTTEDWIGISIRNQDPSMSCLEGNTEYHINISTQQIEVFKFDKGTRTVLYGDETGFEAVYGEIPNKFLTSEVRHSIKMGAVDVDGGVRLFMYVDGNLVFDFVDENSPLQTNGNNYFVIYPETQLVGIGKYTGINTAPDRSALDAAIEVFAGLNADDYTEESYAAAVSAMAQVETLMATIGGVTEAEVTEAYDILVAALMGLVRKDGQDNDVVIPDGTEPTEPGATEPAPGGDDDSSKTGDNTLLIAFAILMALSVAGAAAITTLKRRIAR